MKKNLFICVLFFASSLAFSSDWVCSNLNLNKQVFSKNIKKAAMPLATYTVSENTVTDQYGSRVDSGEILKNGEYVFYDVPTNSLMAFEGLAYDDLLYVKVQNNSDLKTFVKPQGLDQVRNFCLMGLEARVSMSGTDNCVNSNCYVVDNGKEDPSKIKTEWFSGFPKRIDSNGNLETFIYKYNKKDVVVPKYEEGAFYYRYITKKYKDKNDAKSSAAKGVVIIEKTVASESTSNTDGENIYKNIVNVPGNYVRCFVKKVDAESYFTRTILSFKTGPAGKYRTGTMYVFNKDKEAPGYDVYNLPLVITPEMITVTQGGTKRLKLGSKMFTANNSDCLQKGYSIALASADLSLPIINNKFTADEDKAVFVNYDTKKPCVLLTARDISSRNFELLSSERFATKAEAVDKVATGSFCHVNGAEGTF